MAIQPANAARQRHGRVDRRALLRTWNAVRRSRWTGGRFFNADDKPGEVVRGDERLTPVKWCAYTAKADGKPVTVAVFDHPKNPRYPAKMFTMTKPFAYLSATGNEWKEPITIKAGEPLNLRYGVAVWDGEVDKKTSRKVVPALAGASKHY